MTVTVVYGTAGTGKTTWLINQLAENVETGHSVLYFTFSTSASKEINNRLGEMGIEMDKWHRRLSGTIHSLAVTHTLGGYKYNIEKVPYKFFQRYHIPYSSHSYDTSKAGDVFLSMVTYAVHRAKSTELDDLVKHFDVYRSVFSYSLPMIEVETLYKLYVRFKEEKGLLDFNDILVKFLYSEDGEYVVNAVYVDEAQDLSPLMYEIIRRKIYADNYYFVGDPLQNVYEPLLGSDPNLFMEDAGEEILLRNGYRVPARIYTSVLAESHPPKKIFDLYSTVKQKEGGYLNKMTMLRLTFLLQLISTADEKGLTVAILLPKNRHVLALSRVLINYGVLPSGFKESSPVATLEVILDTFRAIERGSLDENLLSKLRKILPNDRRTEAILDTLQSPLFSKSYKRSLFLEYLSERKILRQMVSIPERVYTNVFIDTIHASKGRETDIVILLDPRRDYKTAKEREVLNRLFFVGGTRCRHALYVVKSIEGVKL